MNSVQLIELLGKTIIIVTPWTERYDGTEEYRKGWNDAVNEMRKNRINLIKSMKKTQEAMNENIFID